MEQPRYELYVQINICDQMQGGNLGFNHQKTISAKSFEDIAKIMISAKSFEDIAKIMKQLHELFESLK